MLNLGIFLLLTALSPDLIVEEPEGKDYIYNGMIETEETQYYYGCVLTDGATINYDGLLLVVDKATQTLTKTIIYETGFLETFQYMAFFEDQTFGLVAERYYVEAPSPMYKTEDLVIMKIDEGGNVLKSTTITRHMRDYHNHGGVLILEEMDHDLPYLVINHDLEEDLMVSPSKEVAGHFEYSFQGTATINGVESEQIDLCIPGEYVIEITDGNYRYGFVITINPKIEGIVDGGEYTGFVELKSAGILTLNGEKVESLVRVSVPGFYEVTVEGNHDFFSSMTFTIHPVVENVFSGMMTSDILRIFSNGTSMTLNDLPFSSGEVVAEPKHYSLAVYGVNGYCLLIDFCINPSVSGITDGKTYEETLRFTVNGVATLNGMELEEKTQEISKSGDYELILWFETERYATYTFSIAFQAEETPLVEDLTAFPYWEVGLGIIALIGLFLLLKKK